MNIALVSVPMTIVTLALVRFIPALGLGIRQSKGIQAGLFAIGVFVLHKLEPGGLLEASWGKWIYFVAFSSSAGMLNHLPDRGGWHWEYIALVAIPLTLTFIWRALT